MKIIILPILKFLWAILLVCFYTIVFSAITIVWILWHFKIPKKDFFEIKLKPMEENLSPYFKRNRNAIGKIYYFKTIYHCIFGIQDESHS